jgi:hypothetical protein
VKALLVPVVLLLPILLMLVVVHEAVASTPWIERQDGPNIRAIRSAFHRYGHRVENEAIRVGACESTGDHDGSDGYRLEPRASNGQNLGLFEIHWPSHSGRAARLGIARHQLFDAVANARLAADIYGSHRSWGPWTCRWAATA